MIDYQCCLDCRPEDGQCYRLECQYCCGCGKHLVVDETTQPPSVPEQFRLDPLDEPKDGKVVWQNVFNVEFGQGHTSVGEPSGFVKNDGDKPMFDLIPPEVELEVAKAFTHGAKKYSANNYRKGTRWGRYIAATRRHLNAWQLGEDLDPDSGLSHLAHALASLMMLRTLQLSKAGEDDRVKP